MVSRWEEYRTENGDVLDEGFFNARLKSIDKRVTDLETTLVGLEGQTSDLVRDSIAALNAASAAAQVQFQNSLNAALSDVTQAQNDIEDLADEVNALLGTLGTAFQVDCENGSKVQIRGSAVASTAPAANQLDARELYINYNDKKLYYKNAAGGVETVDLVTTPEALLAKILTVDGGSSGLDADTLDGQHASSFAAASHTHSGYLTTAGGTVSGTMNITANSVNAALRVTQAGSGDVILIEDEASDATPFRVTADGTMYCNSVIAANPSAVLTSLGGAPLASPALSGTPTAPTAAADTNTTLIATTAYVQGELVDRVITSRTVTGSGLVTGGGDLSANRTLTVTKSSLAQAQAGTDDATAMTPLRTKDAIEAFAPTLTNLKWMGRNLTISQSAPSGGSDGDIWFERQ
jgi:hypothetical protein